MTPQELAATREWLEEFAAEVFGPLARSDQRAKGQSCLRGLLLDGRRTSMQPMAERLGVDHQGLQQFVSGSTGAVEPVREQLAGRVVAVIAPEAWVVVTLASARTGSPRRGWPGSTAAAWARSATVRSASACTRSPTPPPARWTGDCSCRPAGTTPPPSSSPGRCVRRPLASHFLALRVRPAGRAAAGRLAEDGSLPTVWLLAEWPLEAAEPTDYWLTDRPETTPLPKLVRLGKIRWRIEHDDRELKTGLGRDHVEGRTWHGWHRHVTLVTAAQLSVTLLRTSPKAAALA